MNRIDQRIMDPEYYYDDEAIEGFINFCESEMTLTNGDPVTLLPHFRLWAEDLLAWFEYVDMDYYNPDTKRVERKKVIRRLTNKQYVIVARGAAKTMYDAFIQAYYLYVDTTTTQQIAVAPRKAQAEETLSPIRTAITVHRGPMLSFLTQGNKLSNNVITKQKTASTKKGIENFMTNSILEIKPMKIDAIQGARSKVNTVDEWLSGAIKEDVVGALEQGAGKVPNYIIIASSSEGTYRDGVGDTVKMELLDILSGTYDDPHTSIWYYRLDNINEVGMPEMWLKANPGLGQTVTYDAYLRDVKRAETQPATRSDILAKRFGIPVEGYTYFFTYEETLLHNPQNFDRMECSMGADLSQGDDFCAFTFLFPLGHEIFGVKTRAYVSENKVRKLPSAMQNRYKDFINEGSLIVMPGGILNMMDVYDDIDEYIMKHNYIVNSLGYDPYNAASFIERWNRENTDYGVTKVIQGARTESVPLGELKRLSEDRHLVFDQELMKFAMGNSVAIEDNNGNYKLSKKRSDEKIDSVAALMDAWVAYKRHQEVYE